MQADRGKLHLILPATQILHGIGVIAELVIADMTPPTATLIVESAAVPSCLPSSFAIGLVAHPAL